MEGALVCKLGLCLGDSSTVWLRARFCALPVRNGSEGRLVKFSDPRSGKNFFSSPDQARGLRGSEVFNSDRVKLDRLFASLESGTATTEPES